MEQLARLDGMCDIDPGKVCNGFLDHQKWDNLREAQQNLEQCSRQND